MRMCRKCQTRPARNTMGRAVCDACARPGHVHRFCLDCKAPIAELTSRHRCASCWGRHVLAMEGTRRPREANRLRSKRQNEAFRERENDGLRERMRQRRGRQRAMRQAFT